MGEDWEQEQRGEKEKKKINEGDVEWVRLSVGEEKGEKQKKWRK
jgi:hypothetical protein